MSSDFALFGGMEVDEGSGGGGGGGESVGAAKKNSPEGEGEVKVKRKMKTPSQLEVLEKTYASEFLCIIQVFMII